MNLNACKIDLIAATINAKKEYFNAVKEEIINDCAAPLRDFIEDGGLGLRAIVSWDCEKYAQYDKSFVTTIIFEQIEMICNSMKDGKFECKLTKSIGYTVCVKITRIC